MNNVESYERLKNIFPFKNYIINQNLSGAYKTISETVTMHLKPGQEILDFGSGPCDKSALLQLMGYKCTGYDDLNDAWHKEEGNEEKIFNFIESVGMKFVKKEVAKFPFANNKFDCIMMNDVIEHLHNSPRVILESLLKSLKNNGILLITVPNAGNIRKRIDLLRGKTNLPPYEQYFWYPDPWRGHIREYVYDDLRLLAQYMKLDVIDIRSCDHMLEKVPGIIKPIYLFITSVFRGWKDSWVLVARKV